MSTTRTITREDVQFQMFLAGLGGFVSDPDGDLGMAVSREDGEVTGIFDWALHEQSRRGQTDQELADEHGVHILRAKPGEDTFTQVTE